MIFGNNPPSVDREQLEFDLVRDEGHQDSPYFDTEGYVTFGVGHNLVAKPLTQKQRQMGKHFGFDSDHLINAILADDIDDILTDLTQNLPWLVDHPEPVVRGIANMVFQMGIKGVLLFMDGLGREDALFDIQQGRYEVAAEKMGNSLWAKTQTPVRATRVLNLISSAQKK